MSYISCEGSALLPVVLPPANSTGAVGSIITPTINTTPVASGATIQVIPATTLPKGRWLVAGICGVDSTVAGATIDGDVRINLDGVLVWRYVAQTTTLERVSVPYSCILDSDGTAVLTIIATMDTSDLSTFQALTTGNGLVQIIRVA